MNVLIVVGGIFVGRRLVESALARGHQVTIFNRGRHNENVPANVEILKGDRNSDLSALRLRSWHSVIDTCGYTPGSVRRVLDALDRDRVEHYTFVSSVSVYAEFPLSGCDENQPVSIITSQQVNEAEEINGTARVRGLIR